MGSRSLSRRIRVIAACAVSVLALVATGASAESLKTSPLSLETGGAMPAEQQALAFDHADLKLKILPEKKAIEGEATLTFTARSRLDKLVVDFDRVFTIRKLTIDGKALKPDAWSNPEGRLTVTLPRKVAKGRSVTLVITYDGVPHEAKRAPWDGGFVWGKTETGEPWIATAVQGDGCDLFWPCIDYPTGEPKLVDLHITVPAPLVAPANGAFKGMTEKDGWRTYHWRARNPNTYAIALNVGPYEELTGVYKSRFGDSIPMSYWHLKGRAEKAKGLFAEFTPMVDFFEQMIGPYPFRDEKIGVVETPHLGMEHQTINAYGNEYRLDGYGFDWLLQHEFAHEWFGNQLTNADNDDMWLHEGFGTYMQPLYSQWLHGDMEYMSRLNTQRLAVRNKFPIVSGRPLKEDAVYNGDRGPGNDIYYKASNVLHTLRTLIGDEAFFRITRIAVYGRDDPKPGNFKPRHLGTKDFVKIVNQVTGKDYGWFFDVYLYDAAAPELVETREGVDLVLTWKTAGDKPFPMPVEVKVGDRTITLAMTGGTDRVSVGDATPVIIDPASKVLRRQPYVEAYQAWRAAADKAAAEARKKAAEEKAAAEKK
ncbi:M1 family metallopeptidase [Caulobacter sp. SL161]|uniref:M1 family metallopeptidase n=1 Tax=Caulobacter sp. SL161 TaxID=2995156 RepID=UPI00227658E1|nr:M1 family metallopeptidase [Caulobacter sp. SL161]MCY1648216.1 M1 family metallopeptidase [Caulobacter sp. SL161]